jgi:hypothetical protein
MKGKSWLFLALLPGCTILFSSSIPGFAQTQLRHETVAVREIPPEFQTRYITYQSRLRPSVRSWVTEQARLQALKPAPDRATLDAAVRARFSGAGNASLAASDIEAVAFIVMMEATTEMDKDMQAIMAEVKAMTNAKQKLRDLMNQVDKDIASSANAPPAAPCKTPGCQSLSRECTELSAMTGNTRKPLHFQLPAQPSYGSLRQLQNQLNSALSQASEWGDEESLRLQMAMDRRSKFIETLSNIMKKTSDTSQAVVSNLK